MNFESAVSRMSIYWLELSGNVSHHTPTIIEEYNLLYMKVNQ